MKVANSAIAKLENYLDPQPCSSVVTKRPPLFIVGAHRSGTTMLRLMLNAHPNLAIPFESVFIPEIYRQLDAFGNLDQKENLIRLLDTIANHPFVKRGMLIQNKESIINRNPSSYAELITVIYEIYAESKGKLRWGDKDPDYVTELDVIWRLFPNCFVLHIVRDGRDVAISKRKLDWGSSNLPKLARDWSWQVTLGRKVGTLFGEHYLEIYYEDLILETESMLIKICDFIGEQYNPKMLDYHFTAKLEMPIDSLKYHQKSIQLPDSKNVFAWKRLMSSADRIVFEQVAGHTLKLFGYELQGCQSTWGSRLKNFQYTLVNRW